MTRCLIIYGPTASGKSNAAMALAERYGGVIINADSMQVYQDLRILTARPSLEDEARVPHRLYGFLDGADICTAQEWRTHAVGQINRISRAGQVPILCGGTGFYLKALTTGLSRIPEIPMELRQDVRRQVDRDPLAAWQRLQMTDPAAAQRIQPMDRQRLSRALEVSDATGRPLSAWQSDPPEGPPPGLSFTTLSLVPPRETIVARCHERFSHMLKRGALEEVDALRNRNIPQDRPLMRAVGVPELIGYLNGAHSLAEAEEQAQIATRRYAKRQITWLKSNIISDMVFNLKYSKRLMRDIFSFIEKNGLIPE